VHDFCSARVSRRGAGDDAGERRELANENPDNPRELHYMPIGRRKDIGAPVPVELNPEHIASQ